MIGGTPTVMTRSGAKSMMNLGRSSCGWNVLAAAPLMRNDTSTGSGDTSAVSVYVAVVWPNMFSWLCGTVTSDVVSAIISWPSPVWFFFSTRSSTRSAVGADDSVMVIVSDVPWYTIIVLSAAVTVSGARICTPGGFVGAKKKAAGSSWSVSDVLASSGW